MLPSRQAARQENFRAPLCTPKRHLAWSALSPLRAPQPRGLACVTMYAGPYRCRFAFFLDVVAAISDEGPGMAVAHHVGSEVTAIHPANRDGAAVAVESPGFAGNMAFANQCAQVFGSNPSGGPSVSARLARPRLLS